MENLRVFKKNEQDIKKLIPELMNSKYLYVFENCTQEIEYNEKLLKVQKVYIFNNDGTHSINYFTLKLIDWLKEKDAINKD